MDQAQSEKTEGREPEEKGSSFSIDVKIEGLPYIFKGKIPQKPEKLEFTIHHPSWQEELARLNDLATQGKFRIGLELSAFEENQGEIAYIYAHQTKKQGADLYIERVRSDTWLSRESPYESARGLGSFLMDNLLTLADVRSWTVSAYPMASGRLSGQELLRWLKRKGFEEVLGENLIRKPREPDLSQPIATLLKPS